MRSSARTISSGRMAALTRMLEARTLGSLVLGPPAPAKPRQGCSRTRQSCISSRFPRCFPGSPTWKKVFDAARSAPRDRQGYASVRRRGAQVQPRATDLFLPVMEDGTVVLVGATTENPSFELNAALLSRARVPVFHRSSRNRKALCPREQVEGRKLPLDAEARAVLVRMADGDEVAPR